MFIAVYHIGNTSNLYISEEKGVNYSLTLEDIISPPDEDWVTGNPTIDVHVVCVCVCMHMCACVHVYMCIVMWRVYSSCQTMGKWHKMHGRMPLSHGLTTIL